MSKYSTFAFKDIIYCGVYMDAYLNQSNEIKKRVLHPYKHNEIETISMNDVYDKHTGKNKKPNGILIQTLKSGLCPKRRSIARCF